MRLRTLLTLSTGAALGAGAMYALDPDQGRARRREVRRSAIRCARQGSVRVGVDVRRRAGELVAATVAGYRQQRHTGHPADTRGGA